jgi:hypothetical protein
VAVYYIRNVLWKKVVELKHHDVFVYENVLFCYWPCRNPCLFDVELATQSLSLFLTNQINRNLVHLKRPQNCTHFSAYTLHTQSDLDDYVHESTNNRKKIFFSTSARCKVRPRAQILIIPPASFADNHFTYVYEVAFEITKIILASKRASEDEGAAQFTRVPPDLTTATLYKYMALRLLFPLHSWHCYVQTESNTAWWQLFPRGIGGMRLFERNGRDTRWIASDFVRALNARLPKSSQDDYNGS